VSDGWGLRAFGSAGPPLRPGLHSTRCRSRAGFRFPPDWCRFGFFSPLGLSHRLPHRARARRPHCRRWSRCCPLLPGVCCRFSPPGSRLWVRSPSVCLAHSVFGLARFWLGPPGRAASRGFCCRPGYCGGRCPPNLCCVLAQRALPCVCCPRWVMSVSASKFEVASGDAWPYPDAVLGVAGGRGLGVVAAGVAHTGSLDLHNFMVSATAFAFFPSGPSPLSVQSVVHWLQRQASSSHWAVCPRRAAIRWPLFQSHPLAHCLWAVWLTPVPRTVMRQVRHTSSAPCRPGPWPKSRASST